MPNIFEKEYSRLNKAQQEAVDIIDGPLMVVAGPGTGKTQLLSMRVANILKLTDVNPENILCLTFTEAAAENMQDRISSFIGPAAKKVQIYTFHGFGTNIITQYPEFFYDQPAIKHLDDLGEFDLLQTLMSKLHHDNPLSRKVGGSFLHLPTVKNTISWIKQAGLNANNLRLEAVNSRAYFKSANKHLSIAFSTSPSAKSINKYKALLVQLEKISSGEHNQTAELSISELKLAIDEIDPNSRYAKSITEWRNKWLTQYKKGEFRYLDQQRFEFVIEVSNLYDDYHAFMTANGLYTYDDMILRTYQAIKENQELKLNLQEKYQYILVDEYQDTNGAQEKLLNQLADNPINEGRPNLMVVGDDDQAIYRFQGAKNSIMDDFINRWRDPSIVVLSQSYRSGQTLLNLSREIITMADNRLESTHEELTKVLHSDKNTKIKELVSDTETENYINVAIRIEKLISGGATPSSISVIAPKHKYLEALVPYLLNRQVPIDYERREHILKQPRIVEILDLLELVSSIAKGRQRLAEVSLSKILAADYWRLSTTDWWEIAISAQKEHRGWIKALESSNNQQLRKFSEAFKILGKQSLTQPFELILAQLLGAKPITLSNGSEWSLPWREYYFSPSTIEKQPAEYLQFIGQYSSLLQTFLDWSLSDKLLSLADFNRFIDLYSKSNLSLLDSSPYQSAKDSVKLTTVYKAKGSEWDNVFILNAQENVWGTRTRSKNLSFRLPTSLAWIEPRQNDDSDLLRLLYVGLTRAKKMLCITTFETNESGKNSPKLEWLNLVDAGVDKDINSKSVPENVYVASFEERWRDIYTQPTNDLSVLLGPVLGSYRLSATHLNDFLSVDRGGPKHFLFSHLLRVPDSLNQSAMYGDAVHKALEYLHNDMAATDKVPSTKQIQDYFSERLRTYPLTDDEYTVLNKKGRDNLSAWIKKNQSTFSKNDISEHNFISENITLDSARLTGKIDLIRQLDDKTVALIDYKTSKPLEDWTLKNAQDTLRAYTYRRQLLFYKLLVDNSTWAKKLSVSEGVLDFLSADEDNQHTSLSLTYEKSELDRLSKLIKVVWSKIISLDLPNIDSYPATLTGIKLFEDDLIDGKI